MIDIFDKSYKPEIKEIFEFIGNPLFNETYEYIINEYKALYNIDYSGDKVLLGWNVSFRKGGRTLCRLYPRKEFFSILVVIGQKEKERVEALLPNMSEAFRHKYESTPEGMGQRWLVFDLNTNNDLYNDLKEIIAIRRASK